MLGYRREELTGLPLEALVPPELRGPHQAFRTGYAEAPEARPMAERSRLAALRKDGATVPVEISLSPVPTASETFVLAVIRDATESRRRGDLADLARGVVAEQPQVTRDLLDRVVGRLFQVGLNLQAASGLPADVLRARLAEALDQLDDAILQIRNYAFGRSGFVRDGVVVELSRHLERGSCGWWRRRPGSGRPGRGPGPAARAAAGRRRPVSASCRAPGSRVRSASSTGNSPPPGPMASQRSASTADMSVQDNTRTCTRTSLEAPPRRPGSGPGRRPLPKWPAAHRLRRAAAASLAPRRSRRPGAPHRQRTRIYLTGPGAGEKGRWSLVAGNNYRSISRAMTSCWIWLVPS